MPSQYIFYPSPFLLSHTHTHTLAGSTYCRQVSGVDIACCPSNVVRFVRRPTPATTTTIPVCVVGPRPRRFGERERGRREPDNGHSRADVFCGLCGLRSVQCTRASLVRSRINERLYGKQKDGDDREVVLHSSPGEGATLPLSNRCREANDNRVFRAAPTDLLLRSRATV